MGRTARARVARGHGRAHDARPGARGSPLIVGEAGMGKTSLVRELGERLPAGTRVSARPLPLLRPQRDLQRARRRAARGARPAPGGLGRARAGAARRPRDPRADARSRRRRRSRSAGGAPAAARTSGCELVSQLGARGPAVVVIEDLHWAADAAGRGARAHALECGGSRSSCSQRRGPSGLRCPAAEALSLERLGDEEVTELVEAALAGPARAARVGPGRRAMRRETRSSSRRCSPTSSTEGCSSGERAAGRCAAPRSISASRTRSRASSPPASTCSRPRRRRRSRRPR